MKYKIVITKAFEVDIYNDGCQPDTYQDMGVIHNTICKDLNAAKKEISNLDLDINDAEEFEGRLELSHLETSEGYKANENSITDWKQDKITLYNASYSIYLSEVIETEINAIILK